jgi:toxin-antitoxin system PIN domain toxin
MSRAGLLDVNVLIALFDPDHVHHEIAHDWFADNRTSGWATCPLTENGFLRVLSNPARGGEITGLPDLVVRLRKFCASGHHQFWPDSISLRDDRLFDASFARGHKQLTDVYLLGLAVKRAGRLITFDQKVPLAAVRGARRETLEVVSSAD